MPDSSPMCPDGLATAHDVPQPSTQGAPSAPQPEAVNAPLYNPGAILLQSARNPYVGSLGSGQSGGSRPSSGSISVAGSECSTVDTLDSAGALAGPPAELVPISSKFVFSSSLDVDGGIAKIMPSQRNEHVDEADIGPASPDGTTLSAGSLGHSMGTCKPCAHIYSPVGCKSGEACAFCHICSKGERQRRKNARRALQRTGSAVGF